MQDWNPRAGWCRKKLAVLETHEKLSPPTFCRHYSPPSFPLPLLQKKSAFKTPCQPTNYIEMGKHITAAGPPCSPPWAYLQPGSGPAPSQQVPRTEAGRLTGTPAPSGWPGQHPPAWAGASTGAPAPLQQPLCHSCRSKEIFPPAA